MAVTRSALDSLPAIQEIAPQRGGVDSKSAAGVPLQSAIYTGLVRHRRHAPHAHAFTYRLFLMYLDLSEIEHVFQRRWLWSVGRRNIASFRRSDYLGDPSVPLDLAVRDRVEEQTGQRPIGPIRLLTHLRYFGHCFNPVSFYYCFNPDGKSLQAIVAEITNTPWKQRHSYVLQVDRADNDHGVHAWKFDKRFHVSPFMAMQHSYAWRLGVPADRLRVHMDVLPAESLAVGCAHRELDVTLDLERKPLDGPGLARVLVRHPFMTLRVVLAIHWQALLLWLKRNPVHDHPDTKVSSR